MCIRDRHSTMARATTAFSRFIFKSFAIEVGGRRHSSSLKPGARRHAPGITIGSVYELRYGAIAISGFVVTDFLRSVHQRSIANFAANPTSGRFRCSKSLSFRVYCSCLKELKIICGCRCTVENLVEQIESNWRPPHVHVEH